MPFLLIMQDGTLFFVSVFILERGICLVWVFTWLLLGEMEGFASAEQH